MKRGNIYFWFAAAVALMAIAGCTKTVHTPENGKHSIGFNVQEPVKSAVTGAADIASFEVWGWYGSNTERNKNVFDGTQVKNTGSGWVYDNIQYWVPDMNYTFYAVYPFGAGECSAEGTITVEDLDCSAFGDNAVDLMTAGAVGGNGNDPANVVFDFVHELSKLKFRFESSQTEVTITDIKLYGIRAGGTLKKAQGGNASWKLWSAVTADNTPYAAKEAALNAGNSYAAEPYGELLLPPHTALTDAKLSFSYYYNWETPENAHKAELQLAAGSTTITSWEAGKSYNYTVKIPATNDIELTVTVAGWDTQDTSVSWTSGN